MKLWKILTLLTFVGPLTATPLVVSAQTTDFATKEWSNTYRYSTSGHPKSKGAVFSLKLPPDFKQEEGVRPNIVQKFTKFENGTQTMVMIITKGLGLTGISEAEKANFFASDDAKAMIPDGYPMISAIQTRIEGDPAIILEYSGTSQRATSSFYQHFETMTFFVGDILCSIQFETGSAPEQQSSADAAFEMYRPIFAQIMNSVVMDDKWK